MQQAVYQCYVYRISVVDRAERVVNIASEVSLLHSVSLSYDKVYMPNK